MKKGPFKLRSQGSSFKEMGSSPVRQKDYEKHYGTYTEYKAEMDKLGIEPTDNKSWIDENYANMPSGKDTKKGYNPKKMEWKGRRIAERMELDAEYKEKMSKPIPDDFTEYLERRNVQPPE